jgi:antitoxin HicB
MDMARNLLLLTIGDFMRDSRPLPKAKHRRGQKYRAIDLPARQSAKVDLYAAFLASGMTKAAFARRAGIAKTHVDRLFSLRQRTRLEQIEAAFAALGKRLHREVREAA